MSRALNIAFLVKNEELWVKLFGKHHVVLVSVVDCLISAFVVSHRGFASDGA